MLLAGGTAAAARRGGTASALGFRRLDCIQVRLADEGTTAEVRGVVHRYPRCVRVSLGLATRLAAEGVPVVVEDRRSCHRGSR